MTWSLEEEQAEAERFAAALAALIRAAGVVMPASKRERAALLRACLGGAPWRREAAAFAESRTRFITESRGLCATTARLFAGRGVEHEELESAGDLGLVHAIDYWEPRPGIRFSAYALSWVRKYVLQRLRSERRLGLVRIAVAEDVLTQSHSCEIDLDATARRRLVGRMAKLPARTQIILDRLYERGETQPEIGRGLNLHKNSVSRIHRRALRSLQAAIGGDP